VAGLDHLVTRWTAEEGRLAVVLRDYLLVTHNIDPVALELGRMATMQKRWMPDKTALSLVAYASGNGRFRDTGQASEGPPRPARPQPVSEITVAPPALS